LRKVEGQNPGLGGLKREMPVLTSFM